MPRFTLAAALLAGLTSAQMFDLAAIDAAPEVVSGPDLAAPTAEETADLYTDVVVTSAATAAVKATTTAALASGLVARDAATVSACPTSTAATCTNAPYTPYYPALSTSYTTNPALSATSTTTAGQACATQVEDGTYCGFINPEDPCAPQPDGYGPVASPDNASAFLALPTFHSMAQAAPTSVPAADGTSYTQVFKDLNGATSAQSYLGLHTLDSYDVAACASFCDCTDLCTSYNIFAERDPSLNPSNNDSTAPTVWGYYCPNPPSMTTFRCTLWGSSIDASTATNKDAYREQFHVVVTASNGYDKTNNTVPPEPSAPCSVSSSTSSSVSIATSTPTSTSTTSSSSVVSSTSTSVVSSTSTPVVSSTSTPVVSSTSTPVVSSTSTSVASSTSSCTTTLSTVTTFKATSITSAPGWGYPGHSTPSASSTPSIPNHPWGPPQNCGNKPVNAPNNYMGSQFFPGPFNPQVCSDYAFAQNAMNKAQGKKQACQMFNAAYLNKNGAPLGTYCSLYNQGMGPQYASGASSFRSGRDTMEVKQSWTWTLQ